MVVLVDTVVVGDEGEQLMDEAMVLARFCKSKFNPIRLQFVGLLTWTSNCFSSEPEDENSGSSRKDMIQLLLLLLVLLTTR